MQVTLVGITGKIESQIALEAKNAVMSLPAYRATQRPPRVNWHLASSSPRIDLPVIF